MKKRKNVSQMILNIAFIIMCCMIIFPFLMLISVSFSNESDIVNYGYGIIPKNIDFTAYKYVLKNPETILNAYGVTALYSILTMIGGVLLMSLMAYPLSRRSFTPRTTLSFILYFTCLFSGGLVPSYILMTQYLHIDNTIWVYIIPAMFNVWHCFMIRTFFSGIPQSIVESASIDGASEYRIFFQMILPLSKPVLATIALYTFLARWNDWMTALLYIKDEKLISLQYLLQRIMNNITVALENSSMITDNSMEIPSETVRMAMAVLVAGPALIVFPFFQKYFVKGVTVGSVKG